MKPATTSRPRSEILRIQPADENHQVLTLKRAKASKAVYRRKPCAECPWRKDAPVGAFPPEAYRHSAETAHDLSNHQFSCHMSGANEPATCAGFLLRGAEDNLAVRMAMFEGRYDPTQVHDGGVELYEGYRSMAIANGVPPDDPAIAHCRGEDELPISHYRLPKV